MPRMPRQSNRTLSSHQSVRDGEARERQHLFKFSKNFDSEMKAISFKNCASCKRQSEASHVNRNNICRRCRTSGQSNLFTASNGMDIGEIPVELTGLSMIEEILIARVHPVVSVFRIRGQQTGYSGHVINFVQHVETIASVLPNDLGNLDSLLILNRNTPSGIAQFRCRSGRVRVALQWLKQHNQYYHDITISDRLLASLPVDGDIVSSLPNLSGEDEENIHEQGDNILDQSCFPNLPSVNQTEIIARNLNRIGSNQEEEPIGTCDWPQLSQRPLDEFSTEGLVCKAFPTLFPYGRGDLRAPRLHRITDRKYFQYLMDYQDMRFAKHMRFPYYAYNSIARWDALNCGSVYVRRHHMEGMSAEDMIEIAEDPDHNLAASIMYYGASLRGTRSYWKQRSSELLQMCRQIGTPTIFFTLSAADYHWPDLFRLLQPGVEPDSINGRQRRELMHSNPSIVAWFFEIRVNSFMKNVMKKYFDVADYWFRYEWQHRGSPHIHGLLWLKDSPNCSDVDSLSDQSKSDIVKYFDKIVSASIGQLHRVTQESNPCRFRLSDLGPRQGEPEIRPDDIQTDLDRLLSFVQRHTHCSDSCMRRDRITRSMTCRFGFPIQIEENSCLRQVAGSWKFIPKRNDCLLQRHNKFISQIWRGNTDFSPITSPDAVMKYISKYASKGEYASEAYSDVLRRLVNRNQPNSPAATLIRQLLVSSVAERNFSAQEVMHLLYGWQLFSASRTFVIIPLRDEWLQYDSNSSNTLLNRYPGRENALDWISLHNYAKKYRIERGASRLRTTEAIVRVVPYLQLSEDDTRNDEYYKYQCKLHIPWRGSFEQILPPETSWHQLYLEHLGEVDNSDSFNREFAQLPDEIEFEEPEREPIIRDSALAASRIRPASQEVDEVGHRLIDESHEWRDLMHPTVVANGFTEVRVNEFLRAFKTAPRTEECPAQGLLSYEQMSDAQQEVMRVCRSQLTDPDTCIRRCIVQGKAGTGKSVVIKSMCRMIDQYLGPGCHAVCAPTGIAAVNIDGKTIHSLLKVPIATEILPLTGNSLRSFQIAFAKIRFIIIDEYSMIGLRMLQKIHLRLGQARGNTEPFGGFFIYFFGDLRQLVPVRDSAIYLRSNDDFARLGENQVNTIQRKIFLTTVHRQNADQEVFKECLDRISKGLPHRSDWELLMTRRMSVAPANIRMFDDSVHLYPLNEQVRARNKQKLASLHVPVAEIEAEHNNATARQSSDSLSGGLSRHLLLSVGCRIMLRQNICVEKGLVNGAMGTVLDIIYHVDRRPPSLPYAILIRFDKYAGPNFIGQTFPLLPVVNNWRELSVECTRKQFPITLAYALTIHKAQGLTLDKATVNIGNHETSSGQTYVALSRVRRLQDLLLDGFDYSRISEICRMPQVIMREEFLRNMEG